MENQLRFILFNNLIRDGNIKLQVNKKTIINLISIDGKVLSTNTVSTGVNFINVRTRAKGFYILKSQNESQKILIQ